MKNDFSELVEYLDGKFSETNQRFYAIESKLDNLTATVNSHTNALDELLTDKHNRENERLVIEHRVKNTENWIQKAAPTVGVKFKQ